MAKRKTPGHGVAERSKTTRKISVALPNRTMEQVWALAHAEGVSCAEIVRRAIAGFINVGAA